MNDFLDEAPKAKAKPKAKPKPANPATLRVKCIRGNISGNAKRGPIFTGQVVDLEYDLAQRFMKDNIVRTLTDEEAKEDAAKENK